MNRINQNPMPGILKKLFAGIISALFGLLLLPILTLKPSLEMLVVDIVYFLPAFSIGLIILFELLTRIRALQGAYRFVQGGKMIALFLILLSLAWTLLWTVDQHNDIVFDLLFAAATIPAIWLYGYLGRRMAFLERPSEQSST